MASTSGYYPARNATFTVTTTSQSITPAEEDREVIVFVNYSTGGQVITITLGPQAAVAGQGIVLSPGDKYGESDGDGFECYRGPIQAISSAAGGTLSVYSRGKR